MNKLAMSLIFLLLATNVYTLLSYRQCHRDYITSLVNERIQAEAYASCRKELTESVGAKAGDAIKQVKASATQTYAVMNTQAEQARTELERVAQNAMLVIQEQAQKTSRDLQQATSDMLIKLNEELERYRQATQDKANQP